MAQMNESARRQTIEDQVEAAKKGGHRQERLPWKDEQESFPVVRLPLRAALLNPYSHRIKSQLMSHPDRQVVKDRPWSDEAQRVIADILRDTDRFERLKENLDSQGQLEPGVITREGILVNANRRATALRELGEQYIDVAVLPDGATDEAISELELALQMREDFREEYTFTNELVFVNELMNVGYTADEVALKMNLAASREKKELKKGREEVLQRQRMLAMIKEIQSIAEETGADPLPLIFFDGKRQSLIEIDNAYQDLKDTNERKADLVKRSRMVGLLTDAGYGALRQMNADFLSEYLLSALDYVAENDEFEGDLAPLLTDGGSDVGDEDLGDVDLLGADEEAGEEDAAQPERLLELLAGSHAEDEVELPRRDGNGSVKVFREDVIDHLTTAIKLAAAEHKEERQLGNRLEAPMKKADDARHHLNILKKKFDRVHDREDFDWDRFEKKVGQLRRSFIAVMGEIVKKRPPGRNGELQPGEDSSDG